MLDYKNILTLRYAAGLSGREIARQLRNVSKTGVNDFLRAFERSDKISFPLPEGITNYGIYQLVYGHDPGSNSRNNDYEKPDFESIHQQISTRKNMTLVYLWNKYRKQCLAEDKKPYQYRQYCDLYARWCEDNYDYLYISINRLILILLLSSLFHESNNDCCFLRKR